jgi:hypothetical protein
MLIYPNSNLTALGNVAHVVFQFIETQFHNWIESSNPANEYKEMYFGDEAIYTKKGAIRQAIETAIDEANETGKPVDMKRFDYDAVFS